VRRTSVTGTTQSGDTFVSNKSFISPGSYRTHRRAKPPRAGSNRPSISPLTPPPRRPSPVTPPEPSHTPDTAPA
jgi:hypothetical protein